MSPTFRGILALSFLAFTHTLVGSVDSPLIQNSTPASAPQAIDVQSLGPKVGDSVPDFSLSDQSGRVRSLSSLMGPKGVMLVFFRSADW